MCLHNSEKCERFLLFLQNSDVWLADGTFSSAPRQFMQIYSIHGLFQGSVYPFVYTFMTRRSQNMYVALLSAIVNKAAELFHIDLDPYYIVTDFAHAAINAFKHVFPNAVVTCCHFHLSQSVLRRVTEDGHKPTYQTNEEFALHVRMLYSLAYLPTTEVQGGFLQIQETMPEVGVSLLSYFNRT